MRFLKTLLWIVFAVVLTIFTYNNWNRVTVDLLTGLQIDTKLPVLVIGAFLIGFVPLWLFHRAMRWRLKRRITSLETQINSALVAANPTPPLQPDIEGAAETGIADGQKLSGSHSANTLKSI